MRNRMAWAAAVALSFGAGAALQADVIYDNTFGSETAGQPPAGWYRVNTSPTTINVGVDSVSGIPANHQAAEINTGTGSLRTVLFNFVNPSAPASSSPVALSDGQSIVLTVLFRANTLAVKNRGLRFGLFDDGGTHFTADANSSDSNLTDDAGYVFRINTGSTAGDSGNTFDIDKIEQTGAGSSLGTLVTDAPGSPAVKDGTTINDSVQHTLTLTLTRVNSGLLKGVAAIDGHTVNGKDDGTITGTGFPTASGPVLSFNSVYISNQMTMDYYLDEVKVETVAVPEPATAGVLVAAGAMGVLGRRRRH